MNTRTYLKGGKNVNCNNVQMLKNVKGGKLIGDGFDYYIDKVINLLSVVLFE